MEFSDSELFSAVKNDSYVAFNHLFKRFYRRLCLFVFGFTEDENASQDVVQELFINLWINRHRISIRETVSGYLFRSARNASLNYLRSNRNKQKVLNELQLEDTQTESENTENEEFLSKLQTCIDRLPERTRQVLVMNRIQGLKLTEISEKLHVSVKTIKNQIWKSLQYLRVCLQTKKI
jgi:RNA polymerase sigma-70 factor (ECF subfamily)